MNIINAEIYALVISITLFIDYYYRFKHKLNNNSILFIEFLSSIIIISILNILITIVSNPSLEIILFASASLLVFIPPIILYNYIEENYFISNYYLKYKKVILILYFIFAVFLVFLSFLGPQNIIEIPKYLTGSAYYNKIMSFSSIPIFILLIEYTYYRFSNKRKKSFQLLLIILLCIIGMIIEFKTYNYSLFSLTYVACAILIYSYLHEIVIGRDNLTGLYNRDIIERFNKERRKKGEISAIYMIDVDFFKKINDTYGHDMGDKILKDLAKILTSSVRMTDYVIRYGGDEFVIIAKINSEKDINVISNKIDANIKKYNNIHDIKITISIGASIISTYKNHYNFNKAFKNVDKKMYEIKKENHKR